MKKGEKRNGFTIIEVSLVIAIAGLVFLMVFIALPQLQRSQRDSRRRDDILTFLETVKKYQTNNRGALPANASEWDSFKDAYLGDSFVDPDGEDYNLVICSFSNDNNNNKECKNSNNLGSVDYTLYVYTKATCNDEEAIEASNPRNIAVLYRLEGSGVYCANT